MRTMLSAISAALLCLEVSAFYPHAPYGPAAKKVHPGKEIAQVFGMEKYYLHKRAVVKRDTSERRVNDFNVEISNTPSLANSAALDEDSTDYSYFCDVVLGSDPGLHVYLLMDTGSSVLWVMGEDCETTACKEHDQFGADDSATYKTGGGNFSISYATGSVSGDIITDQVSFAGINVNMDFGVARTTTNEFVNYPIDGILGLARTPGPGPTMPTFLQILQKNNVLKQNIFGMNLERAADGTNDGEINFGVIDTSKFQGDLNWQNTVGDLSRWTVPTNGVLVNGQFTLDDSDRTAIIDTGTSYLYLPPTDAQPIFDAIPGEATVVNGSYVIPCDTTAQISLVFNGIAYNIPVKDYLGQPLGSGCVCHIFPQDVVGDGKTWLVGDTFLKNVYTVFDVDQSRIGFGAKGETTTITSLVSTATPTVSAGTKQILSSMPSASTTSGSSSGSVSSSGSSSTSTSTASGVLPVGQGTATAGTSAAPDTSSSSSSGSGSGSAGSANPSASASGVTHTTGAGSMIGPQTFVQSFTMCLFLAGILML